MWSTSFESPDMSIDEAILYLRKQAREVLENVYYVYVIDAAQDQQLGGVIMLGVVAFLTAFFLVFVVYVQASALFDSRRHAQELQLNRELADKAEASRFTELRSFLEAELQKLAGGRSGGSPIPADPAILARIDRLEKELLTAVEQSGNSLAAYLGEIEDRLERNAGALPPRQ